MSALGECSTSNDRIYIGNLPPHVSEFRLLSACRQWGNVVQFELIPTSSSGKQYCFALVQYDSPSVAHAAFSGLPAQLRAIKSLRNTIVRYSNRKPPDQSAPSKDSSNATAPCASSSQSDPSRSEKATRKDRECVINAIERKLHSMNKKNGKDRLYNPAAHLLDKSKPAL
uniref:RRM domain-containing protein n=1 Tax=Plectus sambesii TaxID=2011161 RepID=A0A914VGE2_9BILA